MNELQELSREAAKVHEVKVWTEFWCAIESERKPFEVRFNDRNYQVGDTMHLLDFDNATETYTGREAWRVITFVLRGWGLQDGYVALGLRAVVAL